MADDAKPNRDTVPRGMKIAGWIITALTAAAFTASGAMKLSGGEQVLEMNKELGLPPTMRLPLAAVELTCTVLYLIPQTATLGAILLTGYMGGAICTHWRVGDPFVVQAIIGVLVWLGPFLRDRRLWALLPIRWTE